MSVDDPHDRTELTRLASRTAGHMTALADGLAATAVELVCVSPDRKGRAKPAPRRPHRRY
jgi:hypothetical protein